MRGYNLPPSPALSDCDSLAGIDLDAHLAAQGPLSIFSTPQLRQHETPAPSRRQSAAISSHVVETQLFIAITDTICTPSCEDVNVVQGILDRAMLPIEVLAIAYSMLQGLATAHKPESWQPEADLLLLGVLALAENQITDHQRELKFWLKLDSTRTINARDVNRTKMQIFECLSWSLHRFCGEATVFQFRHLVASYMDQYPMPPSLPRICTTNSATATWVYGQLTPAEHSPRPTAECRPSTAYFLPLL